MQKVLTLNFQVFYLKKIKFLFSSKSQNVITVNLVRHRICFCVVECTTLRIGSWGIHLRVPSITHLVSQLTNRWWNSTNIIQINSLSLHCKTHTGLGDPRPKSRRDRLHVDGTSSGSGPTLLVQCYSSTFSVFLSWFCQLCVYAIVKIYTNCFSLVEDVYGKVV